MLGTSFPGPGQKVNENNLRLLRGERAFSNQSNYFINPPALKSEMTLDLLKQLHHVKQIQKTKQNRLKKRIIWGVLIMIPIIIVLLAVT